MNEIEVDRDVLVEVYRMQNLDVMSAFVQLGKVTQSEADQLHRSFMTSDVLQKLIDNDVAMVTAMMTRQTH